MTMIWSCLPVSIFPKVISGEMSVYDWAIAAKEMGFDAIDMSILFVPQRTPRSVAGIKDQIKRAGLPVAMITTYPDFTQPDPMKRAHQLAHAISDIAIASELEAKYLRVTAGQVHAGQKDEDGIKLVRENFEECCKYAEKWGVKLLLENHSKPGAWDNPDFDFHTGRFLALAEAIKDLPIGINFDTANTYALGDDAPAVFEKVYDQVESIHINDISDCANLRFESIGDGSAPISEIFAIARKKGFDGLLSIEEAGRTGLDGIRKSFINSKALWENAI